MRKAEIAKLRQTMNLTQEEFARKLGVSRAAVAKWEAGDFNPSPLAIAQIEKVRARRKSKKK